MVRCGCGANVPEEDGPRHPYLAAEPGCWRRFGELQVRLFGTGSPTTLVVDAYAAQHPGNAERERRQRQSVAVHLVAMCLYLEHSVRDDILHRFRGNAGARVLPQLGADGWPALTPPTSWGSLNASTILALPDDQLGRAARDWPSEVWHSWATHHDLVRGWAVLVLTGDRP